MVSGLLNRYSPATLKFGITQVLNSNSRLSRWSVSDGGGGAVKQTFDNQALNTLFNFGARGTQYAVDLLSLSLKSFPITARESWKISGHAATEVAEFSDIFVTDPPYGDAVKYEEILD